MYELNGSIVALVTPMTSKGDVDFEGLNKLIEWHHQCSTNALVILGSTGEGTLLSENERRQVIDFVVNKADSPLPTWVGVSHQHVNGVKSSISIAADLGADGVMVASPMYVKPSQQGLISYFTEIADASELSMLMYNIPSRTGCAIDVDSACILSHHPNILGIKECEISQSRMGAYQDCAGQFDVFCGDDNEILTCLENGGAGVVSVLGNILPELLCVCCELSKSGAHHKALALEMRWRSFLACMAQLPNPSAIKWVMSEKGLINPFTKMPLTPLTFDQEQMLQESLAELAPLFDLNPEYITG